MQLSQNIFAVICWCLVLITHLLQGQRVFITPNVKPDIETLTKLVKAVHGQVSRFATIDNSTVELILLH